MSLAQPERISQCLSNLESECSDEARELALRTLTSLTKVNPQNRSFLAQSEGAIPTFLSLSSSASASPTIQLISLAVLFNLSLNPDLKPSLASTITIHQLNSIISSPTTSPDSARLAASLICSLAMLDKNKAKFGVAGTIQLLIAAISESPHGPGSTHHLLSSLAELVHFHGNSTLAVRSNAIPVLLQELSGTSLAVLSLLARFDEGLKALGSAEGVVEKLVEVLRGRCMMSKEGAAEILIRLFDESEGCVRDAMKQPGFATVLADLSVRGSAKGRERASLLMRKIMEADVVETYVEAGPLFADVGIEF